MLMIFHNVCCWKSQLYSSIISMSSYCCKSFFHQVGTSLMSLIKIVIIHYTFPTVSLCKLYLKKIFKT